MKYIGYTVLIWGFGLGSLLIIKLLMFLVSLVACREQTKAEKQLSYVLKNSEYLDNYKKISPDLIEYYYNKLVKGTISN